MRYFLFFINGIPGLEEWTDRRLLFEVTQVKVEETLLSMCVKLEEPKPLTVLRPGRVYALQIEQNDEKVLQYYRVNAYEILSPPEGTSEYNLLLYAEAIEA